MKKYPKIIPGKGLNRGIQNLEQNSASQHEKL